MEAASGVYENFDGAVQLDELNATAVPLHAHIHTLVLVYQ